MWSLLFTTWVNNNKQLLFLIRTIKYQRCHPTVISTVSDCANIGYNYNYNNNHFYSVNMQSNNYNYYDNLYIFYCLKMKWEWFIKYLSFYFACEAFFNKFHFYLNIMPLTKKKNTYLKLIYPWLREQSLM